MKGKIICIGMVALLAIGGCRHADNGYREVKDGGITIQLVSLPDPANDKTVRTYKVRLTPDKKLMEGVSDRNKNALYYRMDSCFYIRRGSERIYASLVQPVANGVKDSYEYLLEFEVSKDLGGDVLVYQDRYINGRSLTLALSKGEGN